MSKILSHSFDDTIIRAYDIRGIYQKTLFDNDAEVIGHIFGAKVGLGETVNVGYDGRVSSISLKNSLIGGLLKSGVNVNDVGLVPTPLLYYSCFKLRSKGGVMVTGSHNPKDHNGFKFVLDKSPFFGEDLKKIQKAALKYKNSLKSGVLKKTNLNCDYVQRLLKKIYFPKKLNIVWDSGNGAAGEIMKKISKKVPGVHTLLFDNIDGDFPNHHPDPSIPENLDFCKKKILEDNLDFGIAFDGDGDRIGVVDDKGRIIQGDILLLIFAKDLISKKKKSLIIGDVKCSEILFNEIKKAGANAIISQTGHSHVKENMKKYNADLAGEMSGHMFFSHNYYGFDDALYASVKLIEIVSNSNKKLSEIVDEIPKTFSTPEIRIECEEKIKFKIIEKLIKNLKSSNKEFLDIDGARVMSNDGWWLLRASNTQAVLVLRCEAESKSGLNFQIKSVKEELGKIVPNVAKNIILKNYY